VSEEVNLQFDAETIKQFADFERQSLASARQALLDEHSASFRWIMASLLALNGGGLLAFRDSDMTVGSYGLVAIFFFYIGIGAALLVAMFGQRAVQAMLLPVSEMQSFWSLTAATGEFSKANHDSIVTKINDASPMGLCARFAGYISFVAFTVGMLFAFAAQQIPTQNLDRNAEPSEAPPDVRKIQ